MKNITNKIQFKKLLLGDALVLFATTFYGFMFHNSSAFDININRFLASYIPWIVSWATIAYIFKLYDEPTVLKLTSVWRLLVTISISAPIAIWLREIWLEGFTGSIVPLFLFIFGGTNGLILLIWRLIYRYRRIKNS